MCCERTEPCCRSPGRRPTSDETREPAQVERPLSALAAYALHMIPIGRCRIFLSDRLLGRVVYVLHRQYRHGDDLDGTHSYGADCARETALEKQSKCS